MKRGEDGMVSEGGQRGRDQEGRTAASTDEGQRGRAEWRRQGEKERKRGRTTEREKRNEEASRGATREESTIGGGDCQAKQLLFRYRK